MISLSYHEAFLSRLRNKAKVNAILLFSRFWSNKLFLNFIWLSVDSYLCLCLIVPLLCLYFFSYAMQEINEFPSSTTLSPLLLSCYCLLCSDPSCWCNLLSTCFFFSTNSVTSRFLEQSLIMCWCCIHPSIVFIFNILKSCVCLPGRRLSQLLTNAFYIKQFPRQSYKET